MMRAFVAVCALWSALAVADDVLQTISPSVVKVPPDQDFATVLIAQSDRLPHGRVLNVKPTVGVITSTARTFINGGATTEFASQVLATTLADGRYAHLLARSSRVFYEGQSRLPASADPRLNDVTHASWPDVETFIGNTDFVVTPIASQAVVEPTIIIEPSVVAVKVTAVQQETPSVTPKRVPGENLATFTVGFDTSGVPDAEAAESDQESGREARKLSGFPLDIGSSLARVTYYGFADFTTTVGDTIIVFSPSTAQPEPGHVTSIVGEPTLSEAPRVTQTSQTRVKTQEIFIEPTPTVTQETVATVAPETFSEETPLETLIQVTPSQETPAPEIPAVEEAPIEEEIIPEVVEEEVVEEQTEATTESLEMPEENEISPPVDAPKLSTPTNEDIAKIFESLAKQSSSVQETLVSGGATTIFFEDEPLAPSEVEAPRTITSGDCQNAEVLTYLTTFFLTDTTSVKTNEVTQCHTALSTAMTEHSPEMEASETTLGTTEAEEETTTTFIEETTEALEITTETTDAITETTEAKEVEVKKEPEVEKKKEPEIEKKKEEPKVEKIKEIQIEKPKAPELVIKKESEKVLKIEPTSVVKNEPSTVANRQQPDAESTTEGLSEIELIYKTLYTTYTYLTTFFHESTSSVSTRKEVVTNVVTTTVTPAMLEDLADIVNSMVAEKQEGIGVGRPTVAYTPTPSLEDVARAIGGGSTDGVRTLYTTYTYFTTIFVDGETDISSRTEVYTNYVTQPGQILQTSEILEIQPTATDSYSTMTRSTDDNVTFMVTDVRSSSSNGESEVINNQLEDQVSSESNTDEILPSATLLLQTSYTTFTYFTTMYMGSTSSVVSRLETITNVVTETVDRITPEATLPITYFTTFTYWTTLFRDGTTTTTSREETISNVVSESPEPSSATIETIVATTPTTYFTTYTYFTTSYVGDETVLNSRFETVTNVVPAPTVETVTPETTTETTHSIAAVSAAPTARAIDVKSVKANAIEDGRRNVISRNHGKIVDADGITTILFTTEGVGTLIDGLYAQIIESTSTVVVDESRTAQPTTALPTGLVRLIDGTIVTNHTTTLYQSRVIGTVIDGRYAQIIESTSSYLIDRTMAPATTTATPTIEPTPEVTETTETEEPPEVVDTTRGGGLFATRKRTFTPVIRPFSSRARPTFNPIKRKGATTSALTVTRTDLTPTIRATPASKVESKGRFTSRRSSSPSSYLAPSSSSSSYGGGSSSRRFSRPRPIAPSSTRRPQAPQSTTAELPQETVTTRAPSLRGLSRRPSLAARRTTTAPIITTTTPRARTPLRASFGNRTRIGSLFPPRALFRPQQTEIDQRLDEDENAESETESGRQKRQAVEYGTRARYIGRRTTTTTTTTPQPYFRGSYRRTQPTSRRSQTSYRPQQQRQRVTSRRPPTRTRGRITEAPEYNLPPPDGTLTVTHLVPVSTSVPNIINGNTQYRQIVTQSASVEIVSPGGYSVSTGGDGLATTLLSKLTSLTPSGATEVIQLHLKESPTTTIIFTPTTIRGRRTSFSHIVPTTAYTVERMVSTVNIDANAPLANILLSQLLLGNLNFGNLGVAQTPFANFGNLAVAPTATQPATHYHTRSTTFVTTITNELSTVLPLTFHGKQVLTTIYDRTLSTVTATEYITDTVVETPPSQVIQQQPALNSLLLPLLLQQQASVQDTDAKLQAIEEDPKPSTSVVTLYVSDAEARLLLTTRIMSNGVGVIVAEPQTLSATTVEGGMELTLPLEGTFAPTPTTTCTTQTPTLSDADGRHSTVDTSSIAPTSTTRHNSATNPFAALVPVISAMAGLLATIRRSDPVTQSPPSATHPLYIPLPPSGTPPHRLTPPLAPPAARWLSEEAHRQLLGIPISPGDVITANSDVVIGRPTGLGPRAPPRRPAHILEIRKIPQVYHTDLPPTPLLVNLQPSQVANVLIPHATSAAVVVTTIETTPSLRRDATAEVGRASERHEVLTPPDRLMPPKPPKRPPPAAIRPQQPSTAVRPQQPPAIVRPQQPPAPSPRPPPPLPSSRPAPPRQLPKRPQQPQPPPLPLDVMTPPAPRIDTQTEHNSLFAIRHRPVNVQIPPIRMPPKRFAAASTTTPEVTMRPTWTTPRTTHVEGRTRPTARVTRPTARSTWPTEKYSRSTDNYSWATDSYVWPTTPSSVATTTAAAATESSATPGRRTTIQTIFFEARSTEKPKTTQRKTQKPTKIRGVKTTPSPDLKQKSTTTSAMWTTPWTTRVHITTPRSIASFAGAAGWGEWQNEPLEVIKNKRIEKPRKPIETTKYRVEQPNESDLMRHRLEMPEESIEIKMQTIVKPERTAEKKPEKEIVEKKRNKIEISKEESPEITRNHLEKLPEYSDIVRVKAERPEESSIEIVKQRIEEKARKPVESTKHHEEDIEEPQEPTDIVNHWVEKPKKPSIMVTEYQFDKPRQPTEATRDWIEIPIEPLDYTEYKVEPPEEPLLEPPEYGMEIHNEEIQHTTAKTTELWPKTTPATESTRSTMRFETKQSPTRITAATKLPSRRTSTHTPFLFFTTTPKTTMRTTTTLSAAPTIHELPANLHEFFFTTTSKRPKQPPKIITKSTFSRTTRPPVKKITTASTIDSSTSPEPMSIELVVGTASHARPSVHVVPAAESPPARDEQEPPEVNRVLLGGVLIASPPQPTTQPPPPVVEQQPPICWPACRAHRNEVCQRSGEFAKCACRAGFARMFPDRPCRPTYTYAMAMNLGRFAGSRLFWDAALASNTSARFHHMQAVAHEALHRTAMQSDLRDIYHGLYVSGFEAAPEAGSIQAHFYLQLSDSSDEKRLKDVFGKYLRASNLSLGGTDLFATDTAVEAADFDECRHEALHDCSPHALCFNLKGTYTCSCREGFVDLSENALYPGRQCSAAPIGCAPCNFHGVCIPPGRCECFPWYGGATCRINLKALLIALATLAGVLVCVLVGCVLATGSRIAKRRCGALMVPVVALRTKAGDQRAIVEDNVSETSEEAPPPEPQEKEPSLTVMIPRAKYQSRQSVSSACETKLLSYLDASATASVVSKKEHPPAPPLGALISAGFEVSATVGDPQAATAANDSDWFDPRHEGYCRTVSEARSYDETTIQPSTKSIRSAHEANTMAERDGGSTFLLPHTHLYRPDKISDISGFDSL